MARVSSHTSARSAQRLGVVVGGHRPQHGAQVVGDHDVEQRVEGVLAALGGDVADDAPLAAPRSPREYVSPMT